MALNKTFLRKSYIEEKNNFLQMTIYIKKNDLEDIEIYKTNKTMFLSQYERQIDLIIHLFGTNFLSANSRSILG